MGKITASEINSLRKDLVEELKKRTGQGSV